MRGLGFPRPQTGARITISWKRGFRSPVTPISPCRVFGPKIPIFYVFPCRKKGVFFDRKLPFPERGAMGVFGPRNPLFQKMGIRAPVWGRGKFNERVSGFRPLRKSRELSGKPGKFPGNLWNALKIHSERSSGKSSGNQASSRKFWEVP